MRKKDERFNFVYLGFDEGKPLDTSACLTAMAQSTYSEMTSGPFIFMRDIKGRRNFNLAATAKIFGCSGFSRDSV